VQIDPCELCAEPLLRPIRMLGAQRSELPQSNVASEIDAQLRPGRCAHSAPSLHLDGMRSVSSREHGVEAGRFPLIHNDRDLIGKPICSRRGAKPLPEPWLAGKELKEDFPVPYVLL
jgi:hypothetical protein